ncbi:MAG: hypothetical protein SGJ21_13450 [Alphaproteobacteria bacterium]|nr:hypothetical protein [Alphaproteobacteria bacterium]
MKPILGTALCAAAVALAGAASAQSPDQVIAFLDIDRDGQISLNEYLTFQQPKLAEFDANADGQLQGKEFKASLPASSQKNAARSFEAFNRRGNAMDQEEFLGYHAYVFKNYVDDNRDGFMSAAEWEKVMSAAG